MGDKRLAFVIGISAYQHATALNNPVNDAVAIQDVLLKLGFEVISLKDLDYKHFKQAINEFGIKLRDFNVGLFYFAGHGIQVNGINYLVPCDANPQGENQVEYDCINANLILSLMEDAQNGTNFIFLDACRNNPFKRSWSRSPKIEGLSYMSAPYGTLIAYSTAPGKTASDGYGENGLYTSVLIHELLSPSFTIIQVLQSVRMKVINLSDGNQVPWESTSLTEDFIFNNGQYFSIDTFCESVIYSDGRDNVLNNLNIKIWDLIKVSDFKVPIEKEDMDEGVIEVYVMKDHVFFDTFGGLEYKLYSNGEREYNFFTKTNNPKMVIDLSTQLFNTLGGGLINEERYSSFKQADKIKRIAGRKTKNPMDECFSLWIFGNVSFSLAYFINPDRQLLFRIKYQPDKKVIEDSILKLLTHNYKQLLDDAVHIETEDRQNTVINDFQAALSTPEFDFFDSAIIRLIKDKNTKKVTINVFLTNSNTLKLDIGKLSNIVAKITAIYGKDCLNEGYLSGLETQNLLQERYWTGRTWAMNLQHQIWDSESAGENMWYGVYLNYNKEDKGLELSILGYDSLLEFEMSKTVIKEDKS